MISRIEEWVKVEEKSEMKVLFGVSESSHLWLNLRDFSLKPNNQLGRSARYW
jgi:hypothetical protein